MISATEARTLWDIVDALRRACIAGALSRLGAEATHIAWRCSAIALELDTLRQVADSATPTRCLSRASAEQLLPVLEFARLHLREGEPWSGEHAAAIAALERMRFAPSG